jgi:bisphosphoglycerate-dependent phosphoglycerate mutase
MVLERLSPREIVARELATGAPQIYRLNPDATVAEKQDLAQLSLLAASGNDFGGVKA